MANNDAPPDGYETPTGLPALNKSTGADAPPDGYEDSSSKTGLTAAIKNAVKTGVKATPGLGPLASLSESPTVRRIATEGGAMEAGAQAGTALAAPTGNPAAIVGARVAGSAIGNVVGGTIADLQDHPERAIRLFTDIVDPTKPLGAGLVEDFQKNPDEAVQTVKQEAFKAGVRLTSGVAAQILTLGVSSLNPATAKAIQSGVSPLSFLSPTVIPGAKEGMEAQGLEPDMSQYTTSRIAKMLKTLWQQGIFSSESAAAKAAKEGTTLSNNLRYMTTELAGGLSEEIPSSDLSKMIMDPTQKVGQKLQKLIQNHLYTEANDALGGKLIPTEETAPSTVINPATGKSAGEIPTGNIVYKRVGGLGVETNTLKDFAQQELTKSELINGIGNADKLGGLLQKISTLDDGIDFSDMHNLRSELMDMSREATNDGAKRILNQGADLAQKAMEDRALKMSPDGYKMWKDADAFYKQGKETFNNELMSKIFLVDPNQPEKMGQLILKNTGIDGINAIKKAADRTEELVDMADSPKFAEEYQKLIGKNPEVKRLIDSGQYTSKSIMNKVRRGVLQDFFDGKISADPNAPSGEKINYKAALDELTGPGQDSIDTRKKMQALFGDVQSFSGENFKIDGYKRLTDYLKAGYRATENNGSTLGRATYFASKLIGAAIGGAAGAVINHPYAGVMAGEGAVLLGEGKVASYLLTDPKSQKLFTEGLSALSQKGADAAELGSNLIIKAAKTWADNYAKAHWIEHKPEE